jgi:predicted permease
VNTTSRSPVWGVDRTVVLLLGVAPVGSSTVTFAVLEKLDIRLAVNALSLSLALSLVLSVAIALLVA